MEEKADDTAKCYCQRLREYPDKTIRYRKTREMNKYFIFINFVLCIFLVCVTIYINCVLQQLGANYEQALHRMKGMQNDMFSMKQKYKQMDRRLKAAKEMIYYDENSNGFPQNNVEEHAEELGTDFTYDQNHAKPFGEKSNFLEEILIRNKRAKERRRKKKCKFLFVKGHQLEEVPECETISNNTLRNCLPAIQFEGSSGVHSSSDKHDSKGLWTPSLWHTRYPLAKSAFHYTRIGTTGFVSVKKSGIYLIYAQVTLVGDNKRGYKILVKKTDGNVSTLAVCKRHLNVKGVSESDSCCTVKIVMLEKNDKLFVREESDNTGANYSKSHSYFGLIRLGTVA